MAFHFETQRTVAIDPAMRRHERRHFTVLPPSTCLMQHEWFKHDRFGLQLSVGTLPHDKVMKAIELFGTVVKPAVNKALTS
jgi:hypothetical protein